MANEPRYNRDYEQGRWPGDQDDSDPRARRFDEDERWGRHGHKQSDAESYGDRQALGGSMGQGRRYGMEQPYRNERMEREFDWSRGASASRPDYGSSSGRGYDRKWSDRDYPWRGEERRSSASSGQERGFMERASDEVASWFGDEDAERRRDADQRYRGRGPKNYTRSDERIREDVCDRLADDGLVDASDIDVEVKGSEVTLSGTVQDRAQRRRAEDCAELVSGVTHVQNNLRAMHTGQQGTQQGYNPLGTGTGISK